jgi:hypothetical protein
LIATRWKQRRVYFRDIHPTGEGELDLADAT